MRKKIFHSVQWWCEHGGIANTLLDNSFISFRNGQRIEDGFYFIGSIPIIPHTSPTLLSRTIHLSLWVLSTYRDIFHYIRIGQQWIYFVMLFYYYYKESSVMMIEHWLSSANRQNGLDCRVVISIPERSIFLMFGAFSTLLEEGIKVTEIISEDGVGFRRNFIVCKIKGCKMSASL